MRRYGEAIMPVDILVSFADGHRYASNGTGATAGRPCGGNGRPAPLSAQVDPDRVLLLDVNYTNNSWTLRPEAGAAARKWTSAWFVWLQDALLTWASLV